MVRILRYTIFLEFHFSSFYNFLSFSAPMFCDTPTKKTAEPHRKIIAFSGLFVAFLRLVDLSKTRVGAWEGTLRIIRTYITYQNETKKGRLKIETFSQHDNTLTYRILLAAVSEAACERDRAPPPPPARVDSRGPACGTCSRLRAVKRVGEDLPCRRG